MDSRVSVLQFRYLLGVFAKDNAAQISLIKDIHICM